MTRAAIEAFFDRYAEVFSRGDVDGVADCWSVFGWLVTLGSLAVLIGTTTDAFRGLAGPIQPWHALIALVIGVTAMVLGGVLHTRKFHAAAAASGLSRAETDALADEADDQDDE
jgi:hypothetical protein